MKIIYSIGLIVGGILFIRMTYLDEKKYKSILSTSYVMHFGGYIGGLGAIITGIAMLIEAVSGHEYFNWNLN